MYSVKMRLFLKEATRAHSELNTEFEHSVQSLVDFGKYLGEKKDEEFVYMSSLLEFATAVDKVNVSIEAELAKLQRERKKKAAERERKEAKIARDRKRKEDRERARQNKAASKRRNPLQGLSDAAFGGGAIDENAEMTVEASLEAKLAGMFDIGDIGNLKTGKSKKKSSRARPQTKEEKKMNEKMANLGLNTNEMADLFSLRRASRLPMDRGHGAERKKKETQSKKPWNCPVCTFENSYLLPQCEMCKTTR